MPPNHAALASVGIVAASVAVAAAIAIYEIPEVRRAAEDLRRRIAIALHSLGDNFDPNREPRFNRPEDAEGFYESHDVDADEETRRRQREELMYWNMRREEQQRSQQEPQQRSRGSSFDDFLRPDGAGESGTFVYNTGASAWDADSSNVLRRRGNVEGVRGLNAAILANPFSDEYAIELEDRAQLLATPHNDNNNSDEAAMSDIYSATPLVLSPAHTGLEPQPVQPLPVPVPVPSAAATTSEVLFDFAAHAPAPSEPDTTTTTTTTFNSATSRSATLDHDHDDDELAEDEYMTAGQSADDAYASIQAWAQHSASSSHNHSHSNNHAGGFYSPLPTTPQAPLSEAELVSEGQLTPADSASVVDVGHEMAASVVGGFDDDDDDEMSETDGGVATPGGSWSEVGSVVSESESVARA